MNAHEHTSERHEHEHCRTHKHEHEQASGHTHSHGRAKPEAGSVLTIRAHSGLSGDMFLAGLLCMTEISAEETESLLASVMPELAGSLRLVRRQVNHIAGWHAEVSLPRQHAHRTLADITGLIAQSGMSDPAKRLSTETFALLARAEAAVHE